MNSRIRGILAIFCLLAATIALAAAPKEGKPAPRAQVRTLAGETLDTDTLRGRVVVIAFWATWCTYCHQELAELDRFYRKHQVDGLAVISINMDEEQNLAEVRKMAAGFSFPLALYKDAQVRDYGRIWRLPLTFVIDRRGILRRDGWDGETVVTYKLLEDTIVPLLKEAG